MVHTATVICRSCAAEQRVDLGEDRTTESGFFFPDCCRECGSDDLVMLRDLEQGERGDIEGRAA